MVARFLSLLVALVLPLAAAQETIQVLKVIDFETVKVSYKDKAIRIKLIGVKVPSDSEIVTRARYLREGTYDLEELRARGVKAKNFLRFRIGRGDQLTIDDDGGKKDGAGRMLVYLYDASQNLINVEMIRLGHAYPKMSNLRAEFKPRYQEAFDAAIADEKGLWQLFKSGMEFRDKAKTTTLTYEGQKRFSFMTFNAQNLFDNKHDDRKNDHTFLPLAEKGTNEVKRQCGFLYSKEKKLCFTLDWSDSVLKKKLERVAATIQQINQGRGPDVLLLQEVENYAILRRLNDEYLKTSNYEIIHFESKDRRGIDVAIFSRLKLAELPNYHEIPYKKNVNTRGILECTFMLPQKSLLTVLAMHLPAQMSPVIYRQKAMQYLTKMAQNMPADRLVIAGGDTNISAKEETENEILKKIAEPFWKISHQIGCQKCEGTYYYEKDHAWSFLDMFLISPNLFDSTARWKVDTASIKLPRDVAAQVSEKNRPRAFDPPEFAGVSDHFPVYMEIFSVGR